MYQISKILHFCYGHRLLGHPGKCARLHGHNAHVEITFASNTLDRLGMVIDFEEIKRQVKTFIEQTLDHQMILFEKDPLVPLLRQAGESIVVFAQNPTAENLAQFIFEEVQKKGLPVVSVRLWETSSASAEYKS